MKRNGSLTGAAALLFVGSWFLYAYLQQDISMVGRNWGAWVIFGLGMAILGPIERLLVPANSMRIKGPLGKLFQKRSEGSGWFQRFWGFLTIAVVGVILLALQTGLAPEWLQTLGFAGWWPIMLIYLGIGQLLGFGLDIVRRFTFGLA